MIRKKVQSYVVLLALLLGTACAARQPGDPIRPGFSFYTKEQEIEIGRQVEAEVLKQVEVVPDRELQTYISTLGSRLAAQPEAGDYPYKFTLINDPSINAFALPGGPIFMNSGLIAQADNESQVAGVLAHETSHVALRHAVNQASRANLIQLPAALAAAVIGQGSTVAQLGQLGLGLGVSTLMLRYSRDAESEADALGARLMAQAGYNPIEMATFFEKLERDGGPRAPQFLSSHPNPGNRRAAVMAEVQGMPPRQYTAETSRFSQVRSQVAQLPEPRRTIQAAAASSAQPDAGPSGRFRQLSSTGFTLAYPDNWEAFADRNAVAVVPQGGLVRHRDGSIHIGYGAVASYYVPESRVDLRRATGEIIRDLQTANPSMRVSRSSRAVRVNGQRGLTTTLTGRSPYGGPETNVLLTLPTQEGVFYMVFIAPEGRFRQFENVFDQMVRSIQLPG
jgi:hypothetical protein